jgi:hypothetical protein
MEDELEMMLEAFSEKLVEQQVGRPKTVLAVLAVLTLLILPGALNLSVKPSTEAILPGDDPVVESLDSLRGKFYGDTTYVVFKSEDVRDPELFKSMERIQNRLEKSENVYTTRSAAEMAQNKYGYIPEDREKLENAKYGSTVSEDYRTALISVRADTQAKSSEIKKLHDEIQTAIDLESPPAETDLTGYNMIDLATFNVIINDFIRITGVSFGAVLGVLYFVFRDRRKMMMPIVPVMFALVWMLGLGGWLGANLTIISMVSAAMIMGLGIDFGIHVTKKYYSTNGGKEGMSETMVELSRGLLGGSITTGIGFLSLLFANLSGMHALGIFLFTGIISAYIGAVVLLPVLIIMIESEEKIL